MESGWLVIQVIGAPVFFVSGALYQATSDTLNNDINGLYYLIDYNMYM